ncbi:MAG: DUF4440 domain-containing protein [Gemmatimonadetes bacterium]|nr:DUF4440 domain-containing protein [Gemmatimonadota bacterium]
MLLKMLVFCSMGLAVGCAGERHSSPRLAQESSPHHASPDSAIRAVLEAQVSAWNRGDLAGFMVGYLDSPDLVFTSGGRISRGFADLLQRYRSSYGSGASMGRLEFAEVEVHPLGSSAAWVLGRWQLDRRGRHDAGVFTLVFERGRRGWLIVHDHTSVDAAQNPDAERSEDVPQSDSSAAGAKPERAE